MHRKNKIKVIVAFAVALAFVMPGAAAFANVGTIGISPNSENTGDMENMVESTNSDNSDNTEDTIVAEETGTTVTTNGDDIILWEYSTNGCPFDADRLENGNTLITDDDVNDRIIEVTSNGTIFWEYSTGLHDPRDADRLENGNTLITDGMHNRIIEVTSNGTIFWEYSTHLDYPFDADRLENGNTLITDCFNNCIIEVTSNGTIFWDYSTGLYFPLDADRLEDGNTLITDCFNSRIIEVTSNGTIIWEYSTPGYPADADRLENGNTLITCGGRIIEVTSNGTIFWEYSTGLNFPKDADRLENGNTLISDDENRRVIEVGIPPEITDIEATPPMQVTGGYVNITATVTDNVAVDTVLVDITGPTFATEEMTNIPDTDTYYYNTTYTEIGTYDYFIWANDTSGNENTSSIKAFEIIEPDTTPPVTEHGFNGAMGEDNWFVSDVIVTLNATDDISGVEETKYSLDSGAWQIYADPFTVTADGLHTVEYYSVDFAGNKEDNKSADFKIDQTPPTIDLTVEKTGFRKWLLTATVSDETSGVARVEFYLDGELLGTVTEAPYEWECSEKGTAYAIAYDNAGNQAISDEVPVSYSQSQPRSNSNPVSVQRGVSWIYRGGLTGIQNTQRRV